MRKPVRQWSNVDVISWVNGLGEWTSPGVTDLFRVEVGLTILEINAYSPV